jgi:FkbM family methyltransferase
LGSKLFKDAKSVSGKRIRIFSGDFFIICAFLKIMISLLCWATRRVQVFRGRWRLMKWLKKQDNLMKQIGPTKVKTALGSNMLVNPYEFVGRHIFVEGIYEGNCTNLFVSLLHQDDCVLDVGANIGYFTVLASSLVGPGGQVHAFEASPQIMQLLHKNIEVNHINNVALHNEAVLDRAGFVDFYTGPEENLGLSSIQNIGYVSAIKTRIPCINIDCMMSALPPVKLVKIDVEGAEFMVLNGMLELIKRDKPYIILEFTDTLLRQMKCDAGTLFNFLSRYDYSLYEIRGGGIRIIDTPPGKQCNIFAVHKTKTLPTSVNIVTQ